jgi:hypothetical protein
MTRKSILLAALLLLSVAGFQPARAQADDDQKFEVGGQFSLIRLPTYTPNPGLIVCGVLPCPPFVFFGENREKNEPGFGGRFGYNLNRYFALEAEANYFPRDRDVDGGRKAQVLAGAKVGKRFDKFGLFGKARPGFVRFSQGDYNVVGPCVTIFPAPIGCFESVPKTNFALDLGGVVEFYPSKKTILRFDAGDTMIFFGDRRVVLADDNVPPRLTVSPRGSETTHNLQISAGFGFRF